MGQINSKLRRATNGYLHWCPGCEELHILPDTWHFDGNLEQPTFGPSFNHSCQQLVKIDGRWNGEWVRDEQGNTVRAICHYWLSKGILNFCADSTHEFANKSVALPHLPVEHTDDV